MSLSAKLGVASTPGQKEQPTDQETLPLFGNVGSVSVNFRILGFSYAIDNLEIKDFPIN